MYSKKEIIAYNKGYRISKYGEILNKKGYKIKGTVNKNYNFISFRNSENKTIRCKCSRLQAYQKFGNQIYDINLEVRHLNGNSLDDSYDNIIMGTHSENMLDISKENRIKSAKYAASFLKKYNNKEIKKFHIENNSSYKKTMENLIYPVKVLFIIF